MPSLVSRSILLLNELDLFPRQNFTSVVLALITLLPLTWNWFWTFSKSVIACMVIVIEIDLLVSYKIKKAIVEVKTIEATFCQKFGV